MRGLVLRVVMASALLLGAAVALALALSGDGEVVDPDLVAHSVDVARQAKTARAIFTFTLDAPPGFEDQAVSFGGQVQFDFAHDRSRSTFQFTGGVGGDGSDPEIPEQLEMELVADGQELYLRMPALRQAVPDAPSDWFAVELDELSSVTGERSLGLGASDPIQTLEYLRGASARIEDVGDESVRGVETTHYRVTVDLDRAVGTATPDRRALVESGVSQFRSQFGTTRFPVDVWIDADGLPRRFSFQLDLSEHDATRSIPEDAIMSFTMELFDYGMAVDVEPPPADEVGDLTPLLEQVAEKNAAP